MSFLSKRNLARGSGVRPGNPFLQKTKPIDIVETISPTPIFFIHGTNDPIVDVRHSRCLYEKAKEPKKIRIFENGSHAEEIYRRFRGEIVEEIKNWFYETLIQKEP